LFNIHVFSTFCLMDQLLSAKFARGPISTVVLFTHENRRRSDHFHVTHFVKGQPRKDSPGQYQTPYINSILVCFQTPGVLSCAPRHSPCETILWIIIYFGRTEIYVSLTNTGNSSRSKCTPAPLPPHHDTIQKLLLILEY
jgi:hypothetical protein